MTPNGFRTLQTELLVVLRGPNPFRTDPLKDSPTDGTDEGDLWLNLQPSGDGYRANHTLGVTFYGEMFGELPALYRQS